MARLSYSAGALQDLERLVEFLIESDSGAALQTVSLIEEAVSVLQRHPLIGRPSDAGLRELVISRGATGYVALYSIEDNQDAVLILAFRHQRELDYSED